jgi:ComF family protein
MTYQVIYQSSFDMAKAKLPKSFDALVHLFLPHHCAGCGSDIMSRQQVLCLSCIDRLPVTQFHRYANNPVEKIFWGRLPLISAASYLYFSKDSLLQKLVHQLKYNGHKELGLFMGRKMGEALLGSWRFDGIDALVPLPLYAARERKRGYNQAALLCQGMADVMQVPVLLNNIRRRVSSETQTRKNRIERWQNMQDKFELQQPHSIRGKHILLVDDVITTGATLEACGQALLTAGNLQLSIMTMAYASKV